MNLKTRKQSAAFNKLPANKQRIEIAKDVIAQLDAEIFVANRGSYVDSTELSGLVCEAKPSVQLQEILTENPPVCHVCGLGAIFLSTVRKSDNLTIAEVREETNFSNMLETARLMESYLPSIFPNEQLRLIEAAFEGHSYDFITTYYDAHEVDVEVARQYFDNHDDYLSDEERLRIIMKNIIFHDGDFNPFVQPVRVRDWKFV